MKRSRFGDSYWTHRRVIRERASSHRERVEEWLNQIPLLETSNVDENVITDTLNNCDDVSIDPTQQHGLDGLPIQDMPQYQSLSEQPLIGDSGETCLSDDASDKFSMGINGETARESSRQTADGRVSEDDNVSSFDSWYSYGSSKESLYNDSISGCDSTSDLNVTSQLAVWAIDYNVNHVALRALLKILRPVFSDLPKDPRTLLGTRTQYDIKEISGGKYHHFGIAKGVSDTVKQNQFSHNVLDAYHIQINIDGLPLFKSSKTQFWPILGKIVEIKESSPFIIGLFCGQQKPGSIEEFLHDFVNEMLEIGQQGIVFETSAQEINKTVMVRIACFICDAPARAFVKQCKGHTGYYGCEKCVQKGVWKEKVTFPETGADIRTDTSFKDMVNIEHHGAVPSPLLHLSIGMVSQFVLDPMHLVYLGVTRRLLWLWMKGPVATGCRVGANRIEAISSKLASFRPFIPREFARQCRSLNEVDRWKATEFRQFILYSGIVALKSHIPQEFYQHFLLLFVSIFCLTNPVYCVSHCTYANELLLTFVKHFGRLYGKNMLIYNVHNLVHLAADVEKFGCLDSFTAFPFESFLGNLKKLIKKPNSPLAQIIRRLSERKKQIQSVANKPGQPKCTLTKKHNSGPLPFEYQKYSQFKEVKLGKLFLSKNDSDGCVRVGNHIGLIKNIIHSPDENTTLFLFETFRSVSDFFDSPLPSSDIGIYKVGSLSATLKVASLQDVVCKYVMLPTGHHHVVVPLLHQIY